jgi:2-polyprenyl-6-methoxyphenol hydroxylase-like FAD-dependent oxidoreductase
LVAGASIAGPAPAYRLRRQGAEVTVVERAPELCPGGQAVDARGVEAVEHEWHRWMRSYWQDRLDSVPTQLIIAEAWAMAEWVVHLHEPESIREGVELATRCPASLTEHSSVLDNLEDRADRLRPAPHPSVA